MTERHTVVVVGGGLGGLLVACEVKRRGGHPLVLEAGPAAGGVAATIREDGYLLEPAAGSFLLPHPQLTPILEAADVSVVPADSASHRRYVYNNATLYELAGPASIATGLVSLRGKLRMLGEPFVKPPSTRSDESLRSFFERRFGPEMGLLGATLMAHGVFAGDPDRLSARAAFPAFVELEDAAGSMVRGGIERMRSRPKGVPRPNVHVAANGMAGLAAELADYLGGRFRPSWAVDEVRRDGDGWVVSGAGGEERTPNVVIAVAPAAAARLAPESLSALLGEPGAAPVAVVGLGGPSADVPAPAGFGALTGPQSGVRLLGLLFESSYAPGRAPARHRLLKGIYGGAADPSVLDLTDRQLIDLAIEEAGRMLGVVPQPSWTRVVRHPRGIPQYDVGHLAWLGRLDAATADLPGLHFAGWGYRGIGVSSLAKNAAQLGEIVLGRSGPVPRAGPL